MWYQGATLADLDGDGRPDLAIVRELGSSPRGFQYQVELHLTSRIGRSFFQVSAASGGLRLIPRDVDGDHDLDLVITDVWSRSPVGVWINDGHASFTKGDSAAYPPSTWTEAPEILSSASRPTVQAALPLSYQFEVDCFSAAFFYNELFSRRALLPVTSGLPAFSTSRPRTRAPPDSVPQ